MSTVVHSLGELEHVYAARQLKLITKAWITLSSPDGLQFPFSSILDDLEKISRSETWIACVNSFQIAITLRFDSIAVEHGNEANHLEDLGAVLCNAEVVPKSAVGYNMLTLLFRYGHNLV